MNTHKIIKIVAFALAILGSIFALMIMTGSDAMIDNILYVTYAVLGLVIALVLIFVLKGLVTGDIKKTLMTVGAFLAVIFITYAMSSGTDLDLQPFNDKGLGITESISKNVGAGLYAFYVLAVIAIGSMLYGGVKKIFNK
ncbi:MULTISPECIES: hypothetical protein [unclassified Algibacter]|uniref:hypothetical protein n=1 Tax=unclassified Algibacter TaxID=2615009 RepID=UPI00131E8294|nr:MULTISPECIES: hypothetical protein [unclassified Algibacter]MCL5127540.1 hypothetical protein [Algibacter sp. L4_22]